LIGWLISAAWQTSHAFRHSLLKKAYSHIFDTQYPRFFHPAAHPPAPSFFSGGAVFAQLRVTASARNVPSG